MPPKQTLPLEATGVPPEQQVALAAPPPGAPPAPNQLLGLAQQGIDLAAVQRQAAEAAVPAADTHTLSVLAGIGGILGALSGRGDVATGALTAINQRQTQRNDQVQRALTGIERGMQDAQEQATRDREAQQREGLKTAVRQEMRLLSPEHQAVVGAMIESGADPKQALEYVYKTRDDLRAERRFELDEKIKMSTLGLNIAQKKLTIAQTELTNEQKRLTLQNENAKTFDELTEGKKRELTNKAFTDFAKDKDADQILGALNPLADIRRELGGDLMSPEALERLRVLTTADAAYISKLPRGTNADARLYRAIQAVAGNLAFLTGGKNFTGNEKAMVEAMRGISLDPMGLVGQRPELLASAIQLMEQEALDRNNATISVYNARSPKLGELLSEMGDLRAPGMYDAIKSKAALSRDFNIDQEPQVAAGVVTGPEAKQLQSTYSTFSKARKLQAWADYLEAAQSAGLPVPTPTADGYRGFGDIKQDFLAPRKK